ncbi:SDR family NAD(P)-dependent oxidoreductase [Komagataeibacter sp. FNDCR2]|uniref:SDR family NAD(P)-dependent oxidoreductase n=1 Tax=Komagataeibacter sp. FNDCR2 TaxID=2878682 RepID=UPI001E495C02|nr:SDR family oxidoreductase [Komagataeibacter sp. FNDCR2]MCE2574110.1 SDR family oxidoreductase [Komagataeibacter sp. FNDCR2]
MRARHVLVTGGSKDIGREIARKMTLSGDIVTVLGRSDALLEAAVNAGEAHHYVVADITCEKELDDAFHTAVAKAGAIDVLINNAGGSASARFADMTMDAFVQAFRLNVLGAARLCQLALPSMVERKDGRIVNVASTAALRGYTYVSPYVTAKHALLGLTRSLALEYARHDITVNAVCPGFTESDLVRDSVERIVKKSGRPADDIRTEFARFNPRGRLNSVEEVAVAVAFLCGREAGAINGIALPVAGGEVG